jgi:F420-dependent oxidoreductase-like protein
MRIGINIGASPKAANAIDDLVGQTRAASEAGLASVWLSQIMDVDALTAVAVIGHEVPGIELGTAVIPTYPRHPMMLAGQAMTAQAACGNRLTLGIGLSHQIVIESMFGYSWVKPARHMREYLSVLNPLMQGRQVSFEGETVTARPMAPITVAGAEAPPVLVAALGPVMLKLAGELADGTITWMVGAKTLSSHIVPSIAAAAAAARRPAPRIAVGLPVCVTEDVDRARQTAAQAFAIYGQLPSYRAMLDREGAEGPADVAIVGDEETVAAALAGLADAGATDLTAPPFGSGEERRRTLALLAELARQSS